MIILGLDPSLRQFGWSLHDTEAEGKDRCTGRGRFKTTAKDLFINRYTSMRSNLRLLIKAHQPDKVGIESPVFNDLWSEGMYGLFLYCNEALYLERKDVVFLSPGQVKASARSLISRPENWKMGKPDMVEAAKLDTGGKGRWNHNEADAYLVARQAGRFWKLFEGGLQETDLTDVERHQFLKMHTFIRGKKAGETVKKGIYHREDDRFFLWSKTNLEQEPFHE